MNEINLKYKFVIQFFFGIMKYTFENIDFER